MVQSSQKPLPSTNLEKAIKTGFSLILSRRGMTLAAGGIILCAGFLAGYALQPSYPADGAAASTETATKTADDNQLVLSGDNDDPAPDASAGDESPPEQHWPRVTQHTIEIQRGDTLAQILNRAGIDGGQSYKVITALKEQFKPRYLQVGQEISLETTKLDADQKTPLLNNLAMDADIDSRLVVSRSDDGSYASKMESLPVTRVTVHAGGKISGSLFLSAQRQGVPTAVIVEMIRAYSFDVDFQREIREGDRFEVYFDRFVSPDGSRLKEGRVLYANLTLSGHDIPLYYYTPSDGGQSDYFHPNGESVKKALMRTPVDGARISSSFGRRKHPILGYTRMHKGIDFACPRGTPIMAAGDGVIERASRYGSYGNFIRIRHNSTYETAYAHLKAYARGIHKGIRVKQGQIIGYVGTTGRSTGPHLHYEVLYNGRATNPMSLKIPAGEKLKGVQLAAFKNYATSLNTEVASIPMSVRLARN